MEHIGVAAGNDGKEQRQRGAIDEGDARRGPHGICHCAFDGGMALNRQETRDGCGEGGRQHLPALDHQEPPGEPRNGGDEEDRHQLGMARSPRLGGGSGGPGHAQTFSIALRPRRPVGRNTRNPMTTRKANTWR